MKSFIATNFIDSYKILEHYYFKGFIDHPKHIEEYMFAEIHSKDPYKPDYVYKNVMQDFVKDKTLSRLTIDSFKELSDMLEFHSNRVYVKAECFERWQEIILSVSPLAIISYFIYEQSEKSFRTDINELISSIFDKSALPSIFDPQLDQMIAKEGLNEMHMHLMGTAEADIVWHDALSNPTKFYSFLVKSLNNSTVTEQYLQLGNIEQQDFFRLLMIAKQLRDIMIQMIYGEQIDPLDDFTQEGFDIGKLLYYTSIVHPMKETENVNFTNAWQYESLFFIRAYNHLISLPNRWFSQLFHYYLLIYSFFQKTLVQQKNQVGFEQFQRITINELREYTERKEYYRRYRQLQGMYGNSLSVLEGRFAPKEKLSESLDLIGLIKRGYKKDIKKAFDLKIVSHFPKEQDKRKPKDIITFRDLELRLKTIKKCNSLLDTMNHPEYESLIVGFDAAANELHASPEVFAPTFRKLRFLGYSNFTYHAGEDFIHLLSGLRMVYEAVDFLEMHSGNRIGHGTALGIDPKLWEKRLYESKLTIKKGEWLDDLIFAYELLQNVNEYYGYLGKLQGEIFKYFQEIYHYKNPVNIYQIIEAWKARKYDPLIVLKWRKPSIFEEFDTQELNDFNQLDHVIQELYELYHTGSCIEEYNKFIEVIPTQAPFAVELLRDLQNIMIKLLNEKNIVIETLPTSNLRISYYKHYSEHHIWRWLGFDDNNYKVNDPKPTVVVGSDDTGIFMTNLRNEYAHIYQTILKFKDQHIALNTVCQLNSNSKSFTFHLVDVGNG
ncbi:MAG: hypothetical protein RBR12_02135 [Sulfurospirillum cavolei]|nr:hypothetical protein [Sulfurospirillum cavolei]